MKSKSKEEIRNEVLKELKTYADYKRNIEPHDMLVWAVMDVAIDKTAEHFKKEIKKLNLCEHHPVQNCNCKERIARLFDDV